MLFIFKRCITLTSLINKIERINYGSRSSKINRAGLATIALAGAGIGIGNIFASYVSAAIRNPSAAPKVFGNVLLGSRLLKQ